MSELEKIKKLLDAISVCEVYPEGYMFFGDKDKDENGDILSEKFDEYVTTELKANLLYDNDFDVASVLECLDSVNYFFAPEMSDIIFQLLL